MGGEGWGVMTNNVTVCVSMCDCVPSTVHVHM